MTTLSESLTRIRNLANGPQPDFEQIEDHDEDNPATYGDLRRVLDAYENGERK